MKKTKLITGIAALTFAATLLGACQPDNAKDSGASSEASSAKTSESTAQSSEAKAPADIKIADGKTTAVWPSGW